MTIIEFTGDGTRYILLGAGYGQWAMARPNRILGDLFAMENRGDTHMLYVCDEAGEVHWIHPDEARVVSVDGVSPGAALKSI